MTVGERVKRRREECGLSVIELASRLQKSRSTVYRYESDEIQDMPITVLEPLANALSTTPAYLMGWTDDPEDYDDDDLSDVRSELIEYFDGDARKIRAFLQAEREDVGNETAAHYVPPFGVRIRLWADPLVDAYEKASPDTQRATCAVLSIPLVVPNAKSAPKMREMLVYTYPAAAGLPLYAESDFDRIEFPEDEVPVGADFGIQISGDSMEPTIHDASVVWVHKQTTIREGEIGIFMLGDSAVCKRARMNGNDRIKYLKSDNPAYEPISGSDLEGLRVVGRVLL